MCRCCQLRWEGEKHERHRREFSRFIPVFLRVIRTLSQSMMNFNSTNRFKFRLISHIVGPNFVGLCSLCQGQKMADKDSIYINYHSTMWFLTRHDSKFNERDSYTLANINEMYSGVSRVQVQQKNWIKNLIYCCIQWSFWKWQVVYFWSCKNFESWFNNFFTYLNYFAIKKLKVFRVIGVHFTTFRIFTVCSIY